MGTSTVTKSSKQSYYHSCRALSFIRELFKEVLTMEPDLVKSVTAAYESSLKKYHGWMVQKIFGVSSFILRVSTGTIKKF